MLLRVEGAVVERRALLSEIWGVENEPLNRSVDNHVVSLRRKIEEDPSHPRHILTVHGFGYKLVR
jgi:DNA-binding response OmpR family regulator